MQIGQNPTATDRHMTQQPRELFILAHCQLNVAWRNSAQQTGRSASFLYEGHTNALLSTVVLCCLATEFEYLGTEVLEHSCQKNRC